VAEDPSDLMVEIRRIILDGLRDTHAKVFLFGSRARGTSHRASDVDVAVLPSAPLPAGLLADIKEALEESTIPFDVDLVDLSEVDLAFRQRVEQEGVSWTD
jgi:predicted nucleotidyltransferase